MQLNQSASTVTGPAREPLIKARELAPILGISTQGVWRLVRSGRIPLLRLGTRSYRFDPARVIAALNREVAK